MHFMFYLVNICLLALHHNLKEQEASKAVCFSRKNKKKYIGAMQRAISTDVTSIFLISSHKISRKVFKAYKVRPCDDT